MATCSSAKPCPQSEYWDRIARGSVVSSLCQDCQKGVSNKNHDPYLKFLYAITANLQDKFRVLVPQFALALHNCGVVREGKGIESVETAMRKSHRFTRAQSKVFGIAMTKLEIFNRIVLKYFCAQKTKPSRREMQRWIKTILKSVEALQEVINAAVAMRTSGNGPVDRSVADDLLTIEALKITFEPSAYMWTPPGSRVYKMNAAAKEFVFVPSTETPLPAPESLTSDCQIPSSNVADEEEDEGMTPLEAKILVSKLVDDEDDDDKEVDEAEFEAALKAFRDLWVCQFCGDFCFCEGLPEGY